MNRHRGVQDYQARPTATLGPLFDHAADQEAARRDEGIERATGASSPIWRELAYRALVDLARTQPTVHIDDLMRVVSRPDDGHPNANGGIWLRAIRAGVIERSGEYVATALPGKRRHVYPRYTSLVYGQRKAAA